MKLLSSEAATRKPWVSIWVHSEFILINSEKMSKSTGGFIILDDLIKLGFSPADYRMLILGAHYRSQLNFSYESMQQAKRSLAKLRNNILSLRSEAKSEIDEQVNINESYLKQFKAVLFNDLNSPQGLAILWKLLGDRALSPEERLQTAFKMDSVLGLQMDTWKEEVLEIDEHAQGLLEKRNTARKEKRLG